MKSLIAAALLLVAACEKQPSKLDKVEDKGGGGGGGGAAGGGSLEARVKKLERYGEALEFLQKVYNQQKAQEEQQSANEPDPNAVFAVDITGAVNAGQTEGPSAALITIVEAWDFA